MLLTIPFLSADRLRFPRITLGLFHKGTRIIPDIHKSLNAVFKTSLFTPLSLLPFVAVFNSRLVIGMQLLVSKPEPVKRPDDIMKT